MSSSSRESSTGDKHGRYKRPTGEQRREIFKTDQNEVWYIDSGCLKHITFRRGWFAEFRPKRDDDILLSDNGECSVTGEGTVIVDKLVNGDWSEARIENCCTCRI